MMNDPLLVRALVRDEGLRLTVYRDSVGIETIGVGRNLRDKGITREEAFLLLEHDIAECEQDLSTFSWFQGLSPVRRRALINMRFNLGPTKFREFRQTLHAIAIGDYDAAARHMLQSTWATQVGHRATRLAAMVLTDEEDDPPTIQELKV